MAMGVGIDAPVRLVMVASASVVPPSVRWASLRETPIDTLHKSDEAGLMLLKETSITYGRLAPLDMRREMSCLPGVNRSEKSGSWMAPLVSVVNAIGSPTAAPSIRS